MRKKIALLLATVMLLGIAAPINPVNLLAASSTMRIDGSITSYDELSLILGSNANYSSADWDEIGYSYWNDEDAYDYFNIGNSKKGIDFVLTFDGLNANGTKLTSDATIILELENGSFVFYDDGDGAKTFGDELVVDNHASTTRYADWVVSLSTNGTAVSDLTPDQEKAVAVLTATAQTLVDAQNATAIALFADGVVPKSKITGTIGEWIEDNIGLPVLKSLGLDDVAFSWAIVYQFMSVEYEEYNYFLYFYLDSATDANDYFITANGTIKVEPAGAANTDQEAATAAAEAIEEALTDVVVPYGTTDVAAYLKDEAVKAANNADATIVVTLTALNGVLYANANVTVGTASDSCSFVYTVAAAPASPIDAVIAAIEALTVTELAYTASDADAIAAVQAQVNAVVTVAGVTATVGGTITTPAGSYYVGETAVKGVFTYDIVVADGTTTDNTTFVGETVAIAANLLSSDTNFIFDIAGAPAKVAAFLNDAIAKGYADAEAKYLTTAGINNILNEVTTVQNIKDTIIGSGAGTTASPYKGGISEYINTNWKTTGYTVNTTGTAYAKEVASLIDAVKGYLDDLFVSLLKKGATFGDVGTSTTKTTNALTDTVYDALGLDVVTDFDYETYLDYNTGMYSVEADLDDESLGSKYSIPSNLIVYYNMLANDQDTQNDILGFLADEGVNLTSAIKSAFVALDDIDAGDISAFYTSSTKSYDVTVYGYASAVASTSSASPAPANPFIIPAVTAYSTPQNFFAYAADLERAGEVVPAATSEIGVYVNNYVVYAYGSAAPTASAGLAEISYRDDEWTVSDKIANSSNSLLYQLYVVDTVLSAFAAIAPDNEGDIIDAIESISENTIAVATFDQKSYYQTLYSAAYQIYKFGNGATGVDAIAAGTLFSGKVGSFAAIDNGNLLAAAAVADAALASVAGNYATYANNITGYTATDGAKAVGYSISTTTSNPQIIYVTIPAGTTIKNGDVLVVPMPMIIDDADEDIVLNVEAMHNVFNVSDWTRTIARSTGSSARTKASMVTAAFSSGRIYLNDLVITERAANIIKNGTFTVSLSSYVSSYSTNYFDIYANDDDFAVTYSDVFKLNGANPKGSYGTGGQSIKITLSGIDETVTRARAGNIKVSGLILVPKSNDPYLLTYDSIYIRITDGGTTGVSTFDYDTGKSGIKAATRSDWAIEMTAGTATSRISGRVGQQAADVTIAEITTNSWNTLKNTTFYVTDVDGNVLDDVKITRVGVQADKLYQATGDQWTNRVGSSSGFVSFWNRSMNAEDVANSVATPRTALTPVLYSNASFIRDGNGFIITDLSHVNGELATVVLRFYLTAEANFDGDVYITMEGASYDQIQYSDVLGSSVHVATFTRPVEVTVVPTEIQIGYQKYDVGAITITENVAGGMMSGSGTNKVQIALGEYGNGRITDYLYFAPLNKGDVTYAVAETGAVDKTFAISDAVYNYGTKVVEFTLLRASTLPVAVTINNLAVNVNGSVPKGDYDAIVGGNAIVNNSMYIVNSANSGFTYANYTYLYDKFEGFGVVNAGYIKNVTEGANEGRANNVILTDGSSTILKNGVEVPMDTPAFILDGRFYVPIRWAAIALGVDEGNIIWDDASHKVIIMTAERVVSFTADSNVMVVNGQEVQMTGTDNVPAYAFINQQTGRMAIPASYLSTALNIPWTWDETTGQAIFNPER